MSLTSWQRALPAGSSFFVRASSAVHLLQPFSSVPTESDADKDAAVQPGPSSPGSGSGAGRGQGRGRGRGSAPLGADAEGRAAPSDRRRPSAGAPGRPPAPGGQGRSGSGAARGGRQHRPGTWMAFQQQQTEGRPGDERFADDESAASQQHVRRERRAASPQRALSPSGEAREVFARQMRQRWGQRNPLPGREAGVDDAAAGPNWAEQEGGQDGQDQRMQRAAGRGGQGRRGGRGGGRGRGSGPEGGRRRSRFNVEQGGEGEGGGDGWQRPAPMWDAFDVEAKPASDDEDEVDAEAARLEGAEAAIWAQDPSTLNFLRDQLSEFQSAPRSNDGVDAELERVVAAFTQEHPVGMSDEELAHLRSTNFMVDTHAIADFVRELQLELEPETDLEVGMTPQRQRAQAPEEVLQQMKPHLMERLGLTEEQWQEDVADALHDFANIKPFLKPPRDYEAEDQDLQQIADTSLPSDHPMYAHVKSSVQVLQNNPWWTEAQKAKFVHRLVRDVKY